jgi:hypothetical protein
MEDHRNILREAAFLNRIASITISEVANQIIEAIFGLGGQSTPQKGGKGIFIYIILDHLS